MSPHPAARRLRAALSLVLTEERQARGTWLPLSARLHSLGEAQRHLTQAWAFLSSWSAEEPGADDVTRAGVFLGTIHRRLPILAASLRVEAGQPTSWCKEVAA